MGDQPKKKSAAAVLTEIARERYEFGVSETGHCYALPLFGPRVMVMLTGKGGSLRAELAAAYLDEHGSPPPQQALQDAMQALQGLALRATARALALRVADYDDHLWLDLGDDTGELVRIGAHGWEIVDEAPVLHRRTALTAPLARPVARGDLSRLWSLLNVAQADRAVLTAFLVASLMPDIPHPILLLTGEQGSGKSTAAKIIASIVDASTVPLRKPPRDLDSWTTAAFGSHVVAVDNLSVLPDWLSDALCRAATGDGDVKRSLFTDGDLFVFQFKRVVILNGIDVGTVRDDLADRLVTVDLHRIEETDRARDDDLTQRWQDALPDILGGLLDLTTQVLEVLPTVKLERAPRMADFAHVLAAVDLIQGTDGLGRYREQAGSLASDAVASTPVLAALTEAITTPWRGASAELLEVLEVTLGDSRPPKGWPAGARALTSELKRRAPSLRKVGWSVELTEEKTKRGQVWAISPPALSGDEPGDETVTRSSAPGFVTLSSPLSSPPVGLEPGGSGQKGDEVTRKPPNLSVFNLEEVEGTTTTTREEVFSSSPRHPECPRHGWALVPDRCATCEALTVNTKESTR